MRVLFSITKQSPFFLSLDIPKSEDLGFVSERYPVVNELFRRLDTHYKVERLKIVAESSAYLGQHKSLRRRRIVRSVTLEMSNGFTTGGGTSVTGFTINGINCSARLAEGCVEVTSYEEHAEKSFLVCSQEYEVDNGSLMIEWQKGSFLYGFMAALHGSLSGLSDRFVWAFLES